jgi:hypothetical protein
MDSARASPLRSEPAPAVELAVGLGARAGDGKPPPRPAENWTSPSECVIRAGPPPPLLGALEGREVVAPGLHSLGAPLRYRLRWSGSKILAEHAPGGLTPAARRLAPLRRFARKIPRFLVVVGVAAVASRDSAGTLRALVGKRA